MKRIIKRIIHTAIVLTQSTLTTNQTINTWPDTVRLLGYRIYLLLYCQSIVTTLTFVIGVIELVCLSKRTVSEGDLSTKSWDWEICSMKQNDFLQSNLLPNTSLSKLHLIPQNKACGIWINGKWPNQISAQFIIQQVQLQNKDDDDT